MVPVVDLARRGRRLAPQFATVAAEIAGSGEILLGRHSDALERRLGEWSGGANAVAVSSGAAAIQVTLAGLGVGPGDEVIIPAFTAVPTASAVAALGAIPVCVDVCTDTAALDPGLVESARTNRTKAVVVVHLYGRPSDLPVTDLPIVEDAAQAQGALVGPRRSAAITYSFYPTKNLGGIGDGGAVVTNDAALAAEVRTRRTHGMTQRYVHELVSQNFRMSEIEAAWLVLAFDDLEADNRRRREIASRYRDAAPGLRWQAPHPQHVYHLCVFRSSERESTRDALHDLDVATAIHYPLAVTQQPAYRDIVRSACPEAEAWAASCISVPCFPELTDVEVDTVADALHSIDR